MNNYFTYENERKKINIKESMMLQIRIFPLFLYLK